MGKTKKILVWALIIGLIALISYLDMLHVFFDDVQKEILILYGAIPVIAILSFLIVKAFDFSVSERTTIFLKTVWMPLGTFILFAILGTVFTGSKYESIFFSTKLLKIQMFVDLLSVAVFIMTCYDTAKQHEKASAIAKQRKMEMKREAEQQITQNASQPIHISNVSFMSEAEKQAVASELRARYISGKLSASDYLKQREQLK